VERPNPAREAFVGSLARSAAGTFKLVIGWLAIAIVFVGCGEGASSPPPDLSPTAAQQAVKKYYGALDNYQYRVAWNYLGTEQQTANPGFGTWSRSLKRNYETNLKSATVRPLTATTAQVAVTLNTLDYDACNNPVWQAFGGVWKVSLDGGDPLLESADISKVGGGNPVLAISECQTILPAPPTESSDTGAVPPSTYSDEPPTDPYYDDGSDYAPTSDFCSVHDCIGDFENGNGSIVECSDGTFSHSGGVQGACSSHGGVGGY
jgi:hypothetical protein